MIIHGIFYFCCNIQNVTEPKAASASEATLWRRESEQIVVSFAPRKEQAYFCRFQFRVVFGFASEGHFSNDGDFLAGDILELKGSGTGDEY